jgi:heme/copper-type cytochrome/quinol oxidase subunit 2
MWWWCLIPILILSAIALISYQSGKELKEDIAKKRL